MPSAAHAQAPWEGKFLNPRRMLHDKTIFLGFWGTDQQPYTVIKLGHLLLYVEQQILQLIQSITKQALLSIAMLFDFQRLFLGQPDADQMGPGEGDGQERDQLFNPLGIG